MYPVRHKETVSCEGLFVLTLEAINVTRPCHHHSRGGTFLYKVIPDHPHRVSGSVAGLLVCGDHVDALIQELAHFVLGESVLAHGEQDLDSYCSLLRFLQYR